MRYDLDTLLRGSGPGDMVSDTLLRGLVSGDRNSDPFVREPGLPDRWAWTPNPVVQESKLSWLWGP